MGPTEAHRAFRFTDTDGRLLALRPDVTSSVARAAATLFVDRERPLRLCYAASVFQQQASSHAEWRRELGQIGCELVGVNTSVADIEVLAIASEALQRIGLGLNYSITLNDVEVFNGVADSLELDSDARDQLRQLVDTRNAIDLGRFLSSFSADSDCRGFAQLTRLSGKREVLDKARQVIINRRSRAALDRLEEIWRVVESLGLTERFAIDLGDIARLDYYTGLTFRIYVAGAGVRVGSGGRYDGLTASFGRAEPAVGFVLDIDALTNVLLTHTETSRAKEDSESKSQPIVAADPSAVFLEAIQRRGRGERVLIDAAR